MYVLNLKLNTNYNHNKYLSKIFYFKFQIKNKLVNYCNHKLESLFKDTRYKELIKEYVKYKNTKRNKKFTKICKELKELRYKFKLDKQSLNEFLRIQNERYKNYITSQEMQCIRDDTLTGISNVIYGKGELLRHKTLYQVKSLSASSDTNGIKIDFKRMIMQQGTNKHNVKIPIKIKSNDYHKQECLLEDESQFKYARLTRKQFNTKYHYYIQLILDSIPPNKLKIQDGISGIDIGTQTIAVVNDEECILKELAENTDKYNNKIKTLQRKIEQSRRITNPNNYNEDGTVKKNCNKFIKSKNYIKLQRKLRTQYRKKHEYTRQEHNILANRIIENSKQGIVIEPMNYKALQTKSKQETQRTDKVKLIKNKKVKLCKKKKRYGKSLNNKSPSMFLQILKYKCEWNRIPYIEIDRYKYKASQYNHITDTYEKKKLNERWNNINGMKIQRDLYSAFLIRNTDSTLTKPDRDLCNQDFNNFKIRHDKEIERIKNSNCKKISSFGIAS